MKRISLLPSLLVLVFSVTAYGDYYPPTPLKYRLHWSPYTQSLVPGEYRYRPYSLKYGSTNLKSEYLKYSPYAFEYGKNSMVSKDAKYSPYALNYNSSGLVPRQTQYSPYAFSYNNPGLIYNVDYLCHGGYCSSDINVLIQGTPENYCPDNCMADSFYDYAESIRKKETEDRKAAIEKRKVQIEINERQKAEDPSEAIRLVLQGKNIKFKTSNSLRIEGKTVSVSFVIEDADFIIKFWNSKEISEIAKNDDYRKRIYQNYLKSWEDYCLNNIGNSKKIYNIISGDRDDIFNQLSENSDLKMKDALYAKSQNQPSVNH